MFSPIRIFWLEIPFKKSIHGIIVLNVKNYIIFYIVYKIKETEIQEILQWIILGNAVTTEHDVGKRNNIFEKNGFFDI